MAWCPAYWPRCPLIIFKSQGQLALPSNCPNSRPVLKSPAIRSLSAHSYRYVQNASSYKSTHTQRRGGLAKSWLNKSLSTLRQYKTSEYSSYMFDMIVFHALVNRSEICVICSCTHDWWISSFTNVPRSFQTHHNGIRLCHHGNDIHDHISDSH